MQEYFNFEEKRDFSRSQVECGLHFRYVGVDKVFHGQCVNISGSGVLFDADTAVSVGRALEIRTLPVNRSTPPITAFIEVVRCDSVDDHYRVAGIVRGIKG